MKHLILKNISIAGFIFLQSFLLAQTSPLDSLLKNIPSKKSKQYANHIIAISLNHSNLDSALIFAKEGLDTSSKEKIDSNIAKASYAIGFILLGLGQPNESLPYFDEALLKYDEAGLTKRKAKVWRWKSDAHISLGQNTEALNTLQLALENAKEYNWEQEEAKALGTIGEIYRWQHNIEQALRYYDLAEKKFRSIGLEVNACKVLFNKGAALKVSPDTADTKRTIDFYYELANGECMEIINERSRGIFLTNFGSVLIFDHQYKLGEKYLLEGLQIKEKNGFESSKIYSYNELSTLYDFMGKYEEAIKYGELALSKIDSFPNPSLKYDILRNLAEVYVKTNKFKQAYYFMRESRDIERETWGEEQANAISEMEVKYNLAQKEKEITNRDLEISRQENRFNRFVLLAILALGILSGLYFWYRWKTKKQVLEAEKIKEMDELRSTFFTNISHEFRTPLSLILVLLRKWEKQFPKDEATRSAQLKQMSRNALRLQNLIDQLLDLAKMDAGKMKLKAAKNDLAHFSKNISNAFADIAKGGNIQYHFTSFKEPFEVYFDADILEKIISNLLSNALKFTPENGTVKMVLSEKNGMAEITVSDSGPGISASELPYVFDRFYQAESNHQDKGTGVGLALVKELVELHKGKINVKSSPGEGSVFQVLLPLGKKHLNNFEIIELPVEISSAKNYDLDFIKDEKADASEIVSSGDNPSILVIEDNDDLRHYLATALKNDFEVWTAADGESGLETALKKLPDLVLSDIMMPGMSGTALSEKLKNDERTSHIPIILLTAKATKADELSGLKTGADDYIIKPFDEEILLQKIFNLIQQRNKLKLLFAEKVELRPHELKVDSFDEGFLKKLLEITESNIADTKFSVEQMSQEFGMSRSQLFRKLKALTGETPTLFIRNIRLRRGKQLLEQQFGNVKEVTFAVGFSNPNYFIKCFREYFGTTPGEMVKSQSKDT